MSNESTGSDSHELTGSDDDELKAQDPAHDEPVEP
jgi:hypothetical protein